MSFKRYEKYKDSGVEWIGEIPEKWVKVPLKVLAANERNSFVDGPFGSDLKNEEYKDEGIPLIQLNNILPGCHVLQNLKYISEDKADTLSRHSIYPKDIVIAKMAEPVARAALVNDEYEKYVIVADCVRLKADRKKCDEKFLVYAINSSYVNRQAETIATGTTRLRINLSGIKDLYVYLPSVSEQKAIVEFLDHKTEEIDRLISDKEKLIQLLHEKRQAIISEAVTKGVNPNLPMKDSGIEWIGEMPAHWSLSKLKYLVFMKSGDSITAESIDEESKFPVYGGNGLRGYTSAYTHNGDYILIGRQGALCGNINYASGQFWASEHAVVVTSLKKLELLWLGELLRAMNLNQYSISAAQPGLSVNTIQNLIIPVPPYNEQCVIASYIKQKIKDIECIIDTTTIQISRLKEYRQSIISEAVTGKIKIEDVIESGEIEQ